jgi:hypothetical protein
VRRVELAAALERLLDTNARESELQQLLEEHPSVLVEQRGISPHLVLSQVPLGSDFVADFAYFWSQSNGSYMTLIEIEPPDMSVFNENHEFSARFSHAVQQLADWEAWCRRNPNFLDVFVDPLFDAGLIMGGFSYMYVRTKLIAGRRKDVQSNARRRMRWEQRGNELGGREVRTWDSLVEELKFDPNRISWWGCVKTARYRGGVFEELAVSEMFL